MADATSRAVTVRLGSLRRRLWAVGGLAALALGTVGIALPLLPTVPFYILAAFCFGRSNPALEAKLLSHPRFGPHIAAWREHGAISRRAKAAALLALAGSALAGLLLLSAPWRYVPVVAAVLVGGWIARRPDAGEKKGRPEGQP